MNKSKILVIEDDPAITNLIRTTLDTQDYQYHTARTGSAGLMDADSGRILYEKEGEMPRPNASTTKVLTCILALENGDGDDYVQVSANAASQPQVKLGLQKGEQ